MFIETEPTPNPATLKFLPGRSVLPGRSYEFTSPEDAEISPLADGLFGLGDVSRVLFGENFIAVTIAPGASWSDAKAQIVAVLLDHFVSEAPLFHPDAPESVAAGNESALLYNTSPEDEDIVAQIMELLETRIRPAVAGDGGDVVFRGYRDGAVYLQMQGACAGCPSATATLKHGIEGLLKHYIPSVNEVKSA